MAKQMAAKFPGKCAKCGGWMPTGTQIIYDPNQPTNLKVWHQACDGVATTAAPVVTDEPKTETMPVHKGMTMVKARISELMEQNENLNLERGMYTACMIAGSAGDNEIAMDLVHANSDLENKMAKNADAIQALTVPQKWDTVKVTGHVKAVELQGKNMIVIWAGLGKFGPRVCVKELVTDVSKYYLDPKSVTVVQRPIF